MLTMKKIMHTYGRPICRACINNLYNVKLVPKDLHYQYGHDTCPACGEQKHIVVGFRTSGRIKVLFVR